jgi:hypothetical protein
MAKYLRIEYAFAGNDHYIWAYGKAWVVGAPFLVGALRFDGRHYIPAPDQYQEELAEYSALARSQRRHWDKLRVLNGLERKRMLEKLQRRKEDEMRLKTELPWASEASIAGFFYLSGLEGVYRIAQRGGKGPRIKAVWFPSRINQPDAWKRHRSGQIRNFVRVTEADIFDGVLGHNSI